MPTFPFARSKACPSCGSPTARVHTPLYFRPLRALFPHRSSTRSCAACGWSGFADHGPRGGAELAGDDSVHAAAPSSDPDAHGGTHPPATDPGDSTRPSTAPESTRGKMAERENLQLPDLDAEGVVESKPPKRTFDLGVVAL